MLKKICLTGALFGSIFCHAQQSYKEALQQISTIDQAKQFIKQNKNLKGKYFTFNKENHNTPLAKELFDLSRGGTRVYQNEDEKITYKIINKDEVLNYRVSYIFINSKDLNEVQLKRLKQTIFSKFNQGVPFSNLVKQYSMDRNASRGGDTGWFKPGTMPVAFEDEVVKNNKNHYTNKLFTINISEKNWHYVILKTEEPKTIEEITVLKITETI